MLRVILHIADLMSWKYIMHVILLTQFTLFIAFLEQACRVQQFWCVSGTKIPNIDGENKYLDFVSDRLARF